jgi:hypothetical protein
MFCYFRFATLATLFACCLSLAVSNLHAATLASHLPGVLPPEFFGLHLHRADTTTRWPFVRFGTWRLWDAGVTWNNIEPERGQYRFEKLDRLVELAQEHGVEPVFVLGVTPRWASARPGEPSSYGPGAGAEPRDIRDWENFVRTLATRYKGRIHYFELWNEPKYSDFEPVKGGFYTGTLPSLIALGRSASRVLKEVDPDNRLISPGFTGAGDRLERFLAAGGRDFSDIIAFHFYALTPEKMLKDIQTVQQIMRKQGVGDKDLWNTEQGYEVVGPFARIPGNMGFEVRDIETKAAYIPRSFVLAAAAGVKRFYFYSWERLLAEKETTPTVAANALGSTVRWLKGATVDSCVPEDGAVWVCSLGREGRKAWMVWNASGESVWTIPKGWEATAFESADGRSGWINNGIIKLGQTPLLLKRETLVWMP